MKIDLSVRVERSMLEALARHNAKQDIDKAGHAGTHFDAMDQEFPLQNSVTQGRIFDISRIPNGEVGVENLDLSAVQPHDFVMFHSGILKKYGYAAKEYFTSYVELSDKLIDSLIDKEVSFIGIDMGGAKGPKNHLRIDRYCADKGVFIIENLDNLDILLKETQGSPFTVYTFPVNLHGFSGLPCRVVAEIQDSAELTGC